MCRVTVLGACAWQRSPSSFEAERQGLQALFFKRSIDDWLYCLTEECDGVSVCAVPFTHSHGSTWKERLSKTLDGPVLLSAEASLVF